MSASNKKRCAVALTVPPALQAPSRDFWDAPELSKKIGIDRSTLWRWVKKGQFPRPTYLTPTKPAWSTATYEAWRDAKEARAA